MNPREKRLVIAFGAALGGVALYYIVNGVFVGPAKQAKADYEQYSADLVKADQIITAELGISESWKKYVGRTFSFDESEAYNWFGQALKRTAAEFGFDAPDIKKVMKRDMLGHKTGIYTITYEVTIRADYAKALDFMRGLYEQPYVSVISDVSVVPDPREGRDVVKLSFDVSTPVFPELKAKEGKFLAMKLETMPREPEVPLAPWRPNLMSNEAFAVLERRNILRGFEPAPTNQFLVDNLDPKLVGLTAKFYWDDAVESEVQKGVPPGKQETIVGEGDVVELHGVYADGTEFTQRHEFAKGKQWAYKIPKHTVIEPTIITLAIDNRDTKEARFDVTIVEDSGKSKTLPTMVIDATNKITLGEFDAKEISIAGRYQDGKAVASKKFNPSANEQVYLIPLEPVKPPTDVVVQADEGDRDEPPDGRFTVKGLLTYRNVQEMIVEADDGERRVITAGAAGEVDGGTLFAVCPLGGIVHMPETSHFYLYPRGESFDRRVKLAATSKDDLRDAIYEWSRQ